MVGRIFANVGYVKPEKQNVMAKKKSSFQNEKFHNTINQQVNKEDIEPLNLEKDDENSDSRTETADQELIEEKDKSEFYAEVKLAEMADKYIRLSAEFDNYRKRTLREKIELTKSAGEEILMNIIPVVDDFERALKQVQAAQDCKAVKEGIDLIYNKFLLFLKQHGVKEIDAMNKDFDVDLHEAITKIPVSDESIKGKVVDVVEKGYYLNDKVMRFSKVVVGE